MTLTQLVHTPRNETFTKCGQRIGPEAPVAGTPGLITCPTCRAAVDDREIMCVHTNRASAALTAPPTAQEVES